MAKRPLLLVLTFSLTVGGLAHAGDKARGDAAMESGRYQEALLAYSAAYRTAPNATLLYNMGRAEEHLGRYPDAYQHLVAFSRTASPELRAKVPRLEELIAGVRAHLPAKTVAVLVPDKPERPADTSSRPVTQQWWFWTGVGAVVLGGTAVAAALLTQKEAPRGDMAPGQVSAPLLRF